jgi:dipeptidyl aminopeptidase/acylaminoacyl peptidase
MSLLFAAAMASTIVPMARLEPSRKDPCQFPENRTTDTRDFNITDQLEMADIGRDLGRAAGPVIGMSPDHTQIAVLVRHANAKTNSFCHRVLVLPANGNASPVEIDSGGEFIHADFDLRDFPFVKAGYSRANPLLWSPDGKRIAFLKRIAGSTQVWLADPAGQSNSVQLTDLPDDVDRVAWNSDGTGLVVETRPGIRLRAQAIAREARVGFLYDERFSPQFADRPIPTGTIPTHYSFAMLADGSTRHASADEIALLAPIRPSAVTADARMYSVSESGNLAWLEPKDPERLLGPAKLVIALASGQRKVCEDTACHGIYELWWSKDGASIFALQATGHAKNETAVLRWDMGKDRPHQLLSSRDIFSGCELGETELYCGHEGSAQPRRIVAIDRNTGSLRIVFDPNQQLHEKVFGTVQRLLFRTASGSEGFADLVLPPDHRTGQKHPLIVVQYTSHGFLRGGTGDEVPIHPLANRGFAVLSFSRPDFVSAVYDARNENEMMAISRAGWADRRNVQSGLEQAIELALATGAVDPNRMGISGFSDGAVSVQWALINSKLFKVASLGSCCEDMNAYALAAGPRFTRFLRDAGYRLFEPNIDEFWRPVSLILNADRITTPILIQNASSEYEGGLDVVETFKHRGKAIELFVFDDETHVKWQPAHREAIYLRNTEWFEFWLMNRMNCDPEKNEQYARWKAMAGAPSPDQLQCAASSSSGP